MNEPNKIHLNEETLWNYIDNSLEASSIELHLKTCNQCQIKLDEMKAIEVGLMQFTEAEPSPEFTGIVISNWERTKLVFPWFISLVATCFLFLFGFSLFNALQESIVVSSTLIQTVTLVIIIAGYLIYDLMWRSKLVENKEV